MNGKKEIARITLSSLAPDSLAQLQTMARLGLRVEAIVAEGSPTVVFVPLVTPAATGLTDGEKSRLSDLVIHLDVDTAEMERKLGAATAKVNAFMDPIDRAFAAASSAPDVILDVTAMESGSGRRKPTKRAKKTPTAKRGRKPRK